jgi:hypothetical protein
LLIFFLLNLLLLVGSMVVVFALLHLVCLECFVKWYTKYI